MKRKVVALLQARTDSTRLPGKVLKPLLGKPMIIQELIRVSKSTTIDKLVLLTSNEPSDNELAQIVLDYGFSTFRGSKNNVLERFYQCANSLNLHDDDVIVRLTGDCPVHDATIIDEVITVYMKTKLDYMANCVTPVYPDGLDTEVFSFHTLKRAYCEATKLSEQEHVTPYIRDSGLFKIADLEKEPIHPNWRLTVDELVDLTVIENIYNYFGTADFTFQDIVRYLETNPQVLDDNKEIERNEGYVKSLEKDSIMQGDSYIKNEADKWFDRNIGTKHNTFTEYLLSLFSKRDIKDFHIAEFGVGHANNISILSHFCNKCDGYDGSQKSIDLVNLLHKKNVNINGKKVNLASNFQALNDYDLIIYGFFTYMITDNEFRLLVENSKRMLKKNGYIYIYDLVSKSNSSTNDVHNEEMKIYKRNLDYYTSELQDFDLIDFRLFDNRHLTQYLEKDNVGIIDLEIDQDEYNWTFSALFRLKDK